MTLCECVFTHYVLEPAPDGKPVTALCGKVWIPSKHPDCHKRCPECVKLLAATPVGWVA